MCSKSIAKILLVIFNIVFVLFGAVCLGLGIFVYIKRDDFGGVLSRVPVGDKDTKDAINNPSLLENSSIVLMVAGGFIFLVGFFGCCGAIKEWRLFLVLYIIIVILILMLQIAAGVVAVFFNDTLEEKLMEFLKDTIKDEYEEGVRINRSSLKLGSKAADLGWDIAQITFECCGAENYTDWNTTTKFDRKYTGNFSDQTVTVDDATVPLSCCKMVDPDKYPDSLGEVKFVDIQGCLTAPVAANANVKKGCYESIKDELKRYGTILMIVGIVLGCIEIIGVIAAIYLCCKINEEEK